MPCMKRGGAPAIRPACACAPLPAAVTGPRGGGGGGGKPQSRRWSSSRAPLLTQASGTPPYCAMSCWMPFAVSAAKSLPAVPGIALIALAKWVVSGTGKGPETGRISRNQLVRSD